MRRRAGLLLAALALASCGGDDERPPPREQRGDPGFRAWAAQGCGSCHTFRPAGATGVVGPNLGESLRGRSEDYIRESIVAPQANRPVGEDSLMPDDYARRLSQAELDALVAFIASGVR